MPVPSLKEQAEHHLKTALDNPAATFRDGQWEAIEGLVQDRAQLLVVQRTGWGKSMVYFLATRLLRDAGAGPTLLVSPLLALMRNQIEAAQRIGVRAVTINSTNRDDWEVVEEQLRGGEIDILLISPERLGNEQFRSNVMQHIAGRIGMFVVDEAHCISDWGHDFRPDYRRIVRILKSLPQGTPVLATTATANDRVVDDVVDQLGDDLRVIRGSLSRASLRLQAIDMPSKAERMAWVADQLRHIRGSGIVYARTVRDAERLAEWLRTCDIDARAYHGQSSDRELLEQQLLSNEVKVLVATSALGMGFDKADLAFVIHFQKPGSVVEYYQQVGRAGRNGKPAYGVMLSGAEDDEITDYFIRTAYPPADHIEGVLAALEEAPGGLKLSELEATLNLGRGHLLKVMKILDVMAPSPIIKEGARYLRTESEFMPDTDRIARLTEIRRQEQAELDDYMRGTMCHMAFLRARLDDEHIAPCGVCAVDVGRPLLSPDVDEDLLQGATTFLRRSHRLIAPRAKAPDLKNIPPELRPEEGLALCIWGDAGWGRQVKKGKLHDGHFSDDLVEAMAQMIEQNLRGPTSGPTSSPTSSPASGPTSSPASGPAPSWVCAVPSLRHPTLVPSFSKRLATRLDLPFTPAVVKVRETREQREMQNSHHRLQNLRGAFKVQLSENLKGQDVFLIDDIAGSRWTITYVTALLRQAGAGRVVPVTLAEMTGDM